MVVICCQKTVAFGLMHFQHYLLKVTDSETTLKEESEF